MTPRKIGSPTKKVRENPSELLMEPTEDRPWMVEVVSALPAALQKSHSGAAAALANGTTAVRAGRWMALVSKEQQENSKIHGYQIHVWCTMPGQSFFDQKFNNPVLRFQNTKWVDCPLPLLVSLQSAAVSMGGSSSSSNGDNNTGDTAVASTSVFMFVVHPMDGTVWLWKLSTSDLRLVVAPLFKSYVTLPLFRQQKPEIGPDSQQQAAAESASSSFGGPAEVVTCLTVLNRNLLIGTSTGRLFFLRQNQNILTVETVPSTFQKKDFSHSSRGFLTRLMFGSGESGSAATAAATLRGAAPDEDDDDNNNNSNEERQTPFLVQALFLDSGNPHAIPHHPNDSNFAVLTRHGHLLVFKAHRDGDYAPTSAFQQTQSLFLKSALKKRLFNAKSSNQKQRLYSLEVVQAAFGSVFHVNNNQLMKHLHVLVRVFLVSTIHQVSPEEDGGSGGGGNQNDSREVEEQRLYWLRLEEQQYHHSSTSTPLTPNSSAARTEWILSSATWLDRFVMPQHVQVEGLQVAENGVAYAALVHDASASETASSNIPVLMAHDIAKQHQHFYCHVHELDLHAVVGTRILGIFSDERTFGCNVVTMAGAMLRAECKAATESATSYLHDNDESADIEASVARHPRKVASLLNHLRSTFWESYQDPGRTIVLPPSIRRAEKSDLETAIIKLGLELQRDVLVPTSSFSTPTILASPSNVVLTKHLAYVEFLQRVGIYRSLMSITKWQLLSIGQEIAAFQAIAASPNNHGQQDWVKTVLESLTSFGVAVWLKGVQAKVLEQGSGEDRHEIFSTWLERALASAINFRRERCNVTYDIPSNVKPPAVASEASVPLWTSKPALQMVLDRQLTHWINSLKESSCIAALTQEVEVLVQATLRSYADSYSAMPCVKTRSAYSNIKSVAIDLLRKSNGKERDAVAWSLCKEHCYFSGLCQIAYDHRKESESEYSLAPLFKKFASVSDTSTDLSFGRYVIKWHIDRNLIGDALRYGSHCESDLLVMMNSERSLRPYRWIVSLQRGDYEAATHNLLEATDRSDVSLAQAKFNLAMAKLANNVVVQKQVSRRQVALDRAKVIENRREIAQAQELLLGVDDARNSYPWTAKSLIKYAKEEVDRSKDRAQKAHLCFIALSLCDSVDAPVEEQKSEAAEIWHRALMADWEFLSSILHGNKQSMSEDGIADAILHNSVFGMLVEKCDNVELGQVSIDDMMERVIVDKFSQSDQTSMHRILRTVLARSKS